MLLLTSSPSPEIAFGFTCHLALLVCWERNHTLNPEWYVIVLSADCCLLTQTKWFETPFAFHPLTWYSSCSYWGRDVYTFRTLWWFEEHVLAISAAPYLWQCLARENKNLLTHSSPQPAFTANLFILMPALWSRHGYYFLVPHKELERKIEKVFLFDVILGLLIPNLCSFQGTSIFKTFVKLIDKSQK